MTPLFLRLLVAVVVIAVVGRVAAAVQRPHLRSAQWFRVPGNPGVKIRLTKKGINYMKTVGVNLFNDQLANLKNYSTPVPITQAGFVGEALLSNVRVLHYNPPQVSVANFLPPRQLVLGLEGMDVTMTGDFTGRVVPFDVGGQVDGSLVGLTVAVTSEFVVGADGEMRIDVRNCSAVIGRTHFNLRPTGPMGIFVKNMEGLVNDGLKKRIPEMLCNRLTTLIQRNAPKLLRRLARIDVEEQMTSANVSATSEYPAVNSFVSDLLHNLYLDNAHITQPFVTNEFVETQHRGEFRYSDRVEHTPFYPRPILAIPRAERMLHFYASDHVFNSLLYHAYQANKLHIELNEENLPAEFKKFVATTCRSGEFCIGNLVPAIAQHFPNTTTSFVLISHGQPDFDFNGEAAVVNLSMRVLVYAKSRGRKRQIIVASADGQAQVDLAVDSSRFHGDFKFNTLEIRLHRSAIGGIGADAFEQLAPLARTFIGPQLGQTLRRGIRLPLQDVLEFVSPQLQQHQGFVELATDFRLNEASFRQIVHETFADVNL